jgi:hypothetical protein
MVEIQTQRKKKHQNQTNEEAERLEIDPIGGRCGSKHMPLKALGKHLVSHKHSNIVR